MATSNLTSHPQYATTALVQVTLKKKAFKYKFLSTRTLYTVLLTHAISDFTSLFTGGEGSDLNSFPSKIQVYLTFSEFKLMTL